MKRLYAIIPVGIAIVIILATLSFNYPKEDFSTYNAQWNGCSELRMLVNSGHPSSDVFDANDLKGKDRGAILLLNPNNAQSFSQEEIDTIRSFVEGGGSLLVANDFGNANDLLDGLGLSTAVRFNGSLLQDDYSNWAGSAYPSVFTFSNSTVTAGIGRLAFNYATALDVKSSLLKTGNVGAIAGVGNFTVLARSSPSSYIMADPSSGATSANSTLGEKPVLASLTYGKGRIVLCSDPSVFINDMIGRGDNRQLFANVIAYLTNNDPQAPLFFDESHRAEKPLLSIAYVRVNTDETLKYLAILSVIGAFAAILLATRIGRRQQTKIDYKQLSISPEAMIRDVAKSHPGWSKRQITRLLESTRARKKKE